MTHSPPSKGAFASVMLSAILFTGCSSSSNEQSNNPDFNTNIEFRDYGTYGRTVYFNDVEGNQWCYYDVLTLDNPESITFTISAPFQEKCNTNNEFPVVSYSTEITGETTTEDTVSISTVMSDSSRINGKYSTDYKYTGNTSIDEPLAPFVFLFRADERIMVSMDIEKTDSGLVANIPFITDYIMVPPNESVDTSMTFSNVFTGSTSDVYEDLFNAYGFLDHLKTGELPYPETEFYLYVLSVENRYDIYQDHPYQKLSTTEADPYPLNQIRVE